MIDKELSYYEQFRSSIDGQFHYLYKITNLINNKYYYGIHSTSNINDGYMGSGSLLYKAIKKYGRHNFKKEILYYFDNRKELLNKENEIVNESVIYDDNSYNLSEGGKQGSNHVIIAKDSNNNVLAVTDKDFRWTSGELVGVTKGYILCKDNIGNVLSVQANDPRWTSGELVGITKGFGTFLDKDNNIVYTSMNDPRIINGELKGVTTGRKHIYRGVDEKLVLLKDLQSYLDDGWKLGSPKSNSSEGKIIINNGKINKLVSIDELSNYINDGWVRGRWVKQPKTICVTKSGKTKRIILSDLQKYLDDGWVRGVGYMGSRNPLRNK